MKIDKKDSNHTVITLNRLTKQIFINGPVQVNTVNQDTMDRVYINISEVK